MNDDLRFDSFTEANQRHDQEHGSLKEFCLKRTPSSWSEAKLLRRGMLTDRKISVYAERGWYGTDYRDARREAMAKKAARKKQHEDKPTQI